MVGKTLYKRLGYTWLTTKLDRGSHLEVQPHIGAKWHVIHYDF